MPTNPLKCVLMKLPPLTNNRTAHHAVAGDLAWNPMDGNADGREEHGVTTVLPAVSGVF
jgi:hypothetical protein